MRTFLLSTLLAPLAFSLPCQVEKPVDLHGKYPIRDEIRLKDARFDVATHFGPADAGYDVDLFDIRVDDRPQMRLGAEIRLPGRPGAAGFSKDYPENTELVGACGLENGNVVYANRKDDKYPNGVAVTEVASSVDGNGDLALLRITYPVFVDEKWTGENRTLCLKSAR